MRAEARFLMFLLACLIMTGCLYRGDGAFKQIGNSDYKAQLTLMNLFVAADGRPSYVNGVVLHEDHITPVKQARVTMKKKDGTAVVAKTQTDNTGIFTLSATLQSDTYVIEIEALGHTGKKELLINPDRKNWLEVIVHKE